jgi:hypothetical protein
MAIARLDRRDQLGEQCDTIGNPLEKNTLGRRMRPFADRAYAI